MEINEKNSESKRKDDKKDRDMHAKALVYEEREHTRDGKDIS